MEGEEGMISMEKWSMIRILHKEGRGIREIAKFMKLSRNTVKKYLKQEMYTKYEREVKGDKITAPYIDTIQKGLEQGLIGTRILKEIEKEGYRGSYPTLIRCIQTLKRTIPQKTTVRFETEPGEQGQFDWSPYKVNISGEKVTVQCFLFLLGYSRKKVISFSRDQTESSVIEALENAIRRVGGVPGMIVVDNAKQLVTDHPKGGSAIFHPQFLSLAGMYGFIPYACQTYWPRTKGKVERPFYYIENHLIKGNTFSNLNELNQQGQEFLLEWEKQPNQTTLVPPIERFEEEKPFLGALPNTVYALTLKESRKVSWDCFISFRSVRYSVPHPYAGKQIWIRVSQGDKLELYSERGEWIDQHPISFTKGRTVSKKEHYEGLRKSIPKSLPQLRETFIQTFPSGKKFIQMLREKTTQNHGYILQRMLELQYSYTVDVLEAVIQQALTHRRIDYGFIQNMLRHFPQKVLDYETHRPLPQIVTETRSLDYYGHLLQ
jgi:transposase